MRPMQETLEHLLHREPRAAFPKKRSVVNIETPRVTLGVFWCRTKVHLTAMRVATLLLFLVDE